MTYAGITIADKPALEDAKAMGAEWVARDLSECLWTYKDKPRKINFRGFKMWAIDDFEVTRGTIDIDSENLQFIKWSDPEPVHITAAIAQIAEMEREQKPECPYCASNVFSPEAIGLYDERGSNPYHVFFRSGSRVTKSEQFDFCPKCGKRINSPYTEGETDED